MIVGDFALSGVDAAYELTGDGRIIDYTDGPKEEGKINVRVLQIFLTLKIGLILSQRQIFTICQP